jgi:hypothetical protein
MWNSEAKCSNPTKWRKSEDSATILSPLWKILIGVKCAQRRKFSPGLIQSISFLYIMRKRIALQNIMVCPPE